MTWLMRSKLSGQSDLTGSYTLPTSVRVLAQTASASADYTTAVWSPLALTVESGFGGGPGTNSGHVAPYSGVLDTHKIIGAHLITDTAITGGGATVQATAKILLYDSAGTLVGTVFSLLFATGVNTVAFQPKSLGAVSTTVRAASNYPSGLGLRASETLVFEWLQSATTGLALPASVIVLDIV